MKSMLPRFIIVFAGLALVVGLKAQAPTAPQKLKAHAADTKPGAPLEIDLVWENTAARANDIFLERSGDGAVNFAVIKQLPATATSYNDKDQTLTEGTSYHYRVRAADNSSGTPVYSGYSALANVSTLHPHFGLVVSKGAMDQSAASDCFSQRVFKDSDPSSGGDYVTVKTEVYANLDNFARNKPNGIDTLRYKVTITLPRVKNATYSLLSLGIQANEHSVQIEEATAAGSSNASVEFYSSENATDKLTVSSNSFLVVGPVGFEVKDPRQAHVKTPREENIWLMTLKQASSCTLWVEIADGQIHPLRIGRIAFEGGGYGESHDNEPPKQSLD